jgi:hypothetical protein
MYRFLTKRFFTKEANQPEIITFANGVVIDIENKRIILPDDFALHTTGNLRLTSDKHIIIKSGQGDEPDRPGYQYSIWLNSAEDEAHRPLKGQPRIEDNGDNA